MKASFCGLTFTLMFICLNSSASLIQKEINDGWKFREARLDNWYPAQVPGVVHTDLIRNKIIEDPFFRLNERGVQWVDKEDWVYETSFSGDENILNCNNQLLDFKGLDTYADVYLNDSLLLKANNMFREWKVDVKGILKSGDNKLKIYFHSPIKIDLPKWDALPYHLEASNDQSENGGLLDRKVSIFARKAGYHYGWDWGPRLVTSGIWRPIYLTGWNDAKVNDMQLIQKQVTKAKALLQSVVEIQADQNLKGATILITANNKKVASKTVDLKKGTNSIVLDYNISKPRLWWSNGLGEPYLYDFKTTIAVKGKTADIRNEKIGIRSLKLVSEKDEKGTSCYFVLNGVRVFMKGANYIPCDNFLPRVTPQIYEKTILDAVNVNMNMLRVWGGGIYENDIFYNLCDKYGILIWHDFMFACSLYPADDEFLANVREEAIENVKRLRNHPCMAVWCGNNENQDAWYGWGWKQRYVKQNPEYANIIEKQFDKQYFEVLPSVVEQYGGGISYRPSSPFAKKGSVSELENGDFHYWSVWHGNQPIEAYSTVKGRFFSEYGFQSFPEYESVKIYAPDEKDHDIYSEVMMSHQRGGAFANRMIDQYMMQEFRKPKDFEHFLYVGMVLQGDAIKTAMEAHHRDMPHCMGTLFWQHNDCWPVASWSSRDYYGRWKAVHYFAKKAYDKILVSPYLDGDKMTITLISDLLQPVKGTLIVKVMTLNGQILQETKEEITAKANTSASVFNKPVAELLKGENKSNAIVSVTFTTSGKTYSNVGFFAKQKDMNYEKETIARMVAPAAGGYKVTLTAQKFARAVFMSLKGIDNFFEDNYFDLLPGESKTIFVSTTLSQGDFENQLKVQDLADSY